MTELGREPIVPGRIALNILHVGRVLRAARLPVRPGKVIEAIRAVEAIASASLHEKLLLVLSDHSIRSDWVEREVETAFEKEREGGGTVLFPVRLDEAIMESKTGWAAEIRRTRHIGDFTGWKDQGAYQKAFARRDLRVGPPPVSQASGD